MLLANSIQEEVLEPSLHYPSRGRLPLLHEALHKHLLKSLHKVLDEALYMVMLSGPVPPGSVGLAQW